uniref:Protein takeout n=1 Tax=Stomoxys calcitrans TaxID=35570 RepID=A0A1I8PTR8_STOCA
MYVKRVVITDGGNNPISLNMELTNLKFTGLKHSNFKDASYDHAKSLTKLRMFVPTVQINADYDMKGRVLALPLNGKGKTKMNIENLGIDIAIRLKIRKENGFLFTDVDKLRLEITEVGNFQINLENLFNGQKDLEASAHALFNNNWMELYEFLKPSITSTIQALMKDRLEKMFAFVPATYFIEDLVYGS